MIFSGVVSQYDERGAIPAGGENRNCSHHRPGGEQLTNWTENLRAALGLLPNPNHSVDYPISNPLTPYRLRSATLHCRTAKYRLCHPGKLSQVP